MSPAPRPRRRPGGRLSIGLLAALLLPVAAALAQETAGPAEEVRPSGYCTNIASAAADARFRWQKETLSALEKDIEAQIARLEAKRAEYEDWLRRRQAFLDKAGASVVAIYARMRPEAASQQLASMGLEPAAAILARLDARVASAILNEMEPARAAQLTAVMTDTPRAASPAAAGDVPPAPKSRERTG
ncbi:MotE family protein [Methylobacterium sp. 1030]|uniref:MotE family protein n=1 Tax=Methylobacterium sp. 1030 TaxID=3156404 RepID=UPI0033919092